MFSSMLPIVQPYTGNKLYEKTMSKVAVGNNIDEDTTMLATLRCLLYPRTNEKFTFHYETYRNIDEYCEYKCFVRNDIQYNCLFGKTSEESIAQIADRLETRSWNKEHGVERLCRIEDYVKKILTKTIRIYTKPEINSVIILAQDRTMPLVHLLESFLPVMLKNVFKDRDVTPEEYDMLATLAKRNAKDYLNAIANIANKNGFQEEILNNALLKLEKSNKETKLRTVEDQLRNARQNAENLLHDYEHVLETISEQTIRYEGIRHMLDNTADNTELVEYFKTNKNIKLVNVEENMFSIIVNTYLESIDIDGFNHFKKDGTIYRGYRVPAAFFNVEDVKLLMDNLFNEDPLFKIKLCGYFELFLNGSVRSIRGYSYDQYPECENSLPNPHLNIHNCLSRNGILIADQLNKGELIGAVACCTASTMAVNIHETSQTFRPMMEQVFDSTKKIIHNMETGTDMTPVEALAWLKEFKTEA